MIVRHQPATTRRPVPTPRPTLRRRAVCQFIAMALFGGGVAHAATPPAFSPAWFAQKQQQAATAPSQPAGGNGNTVSYTPGSALLQQRVQQSITNLNNAAAAVAAQMQAQKAAQGAAQQLVSNVPNGLADGGLKAAAGAAADPSLWQNANAPTDTVAGMKHTVEVKQTGKKAILTWDSFNVGRDTTLYFNQSAGNQSDGKNDWIALNRVNDPSAKPSQILGQVKAEGSVYLINRNGFLFGAGSQVNVHALIASSLSLFSDDVKASNATFLASGIANTAEPFLSATFTDDGKHDVVIEKGASITSGPEGFVLVAAPNVSNAGSIIADDGQAVLAASTALQNGTTGLDVSDAGNARSPKGKAENTGLIQARRGAITMLGYDVAQGGTVVASTSIAHPGTINLLAATGYKAGQVGNPTGAGTLELAQGSVTSVLPEKDGTTTSSSADADKAFVSGKVTLAGGQVILDRGALVEAPGADVSLTALVPGGSVPDDAGRVYIDSGATIDVSGLANVTLPMSALLITIPRVGQNELANSPLLRNSFLYTQKNIVLDSTASGTRADGLDWIGSPILNAAGYVENVPRDISQMLTKGGNISLDGRQVMVREGANLNLDGGYLAYQAGWIDTPNLMGADGRIYNIASADPDVDYVGFAGQYTQTHARWGVSQTYNSPVMGGAHRWDPGFIVGSDAGTLSVQATDALVLDGTISAKAMAGSHQVQAGTQPNGGSFVLGEAPTAGAPRYYHGIRIQQNTLPLGDTLPDFSADSLWASFLAAQDGSATDATDARDWLTVSADMVAKAGFDSVNISTPSAIVEAAGSSLVVGAGGSVTLQGGRIDILGDIRAPAGAIALTTGSPIAAPGPGTDPGALQPADITIGSGATLSTRGLWVNDTGLSADQVVGDRYVNGGTISLATQQASWGNTANRVDGTGSINLQAGSALDVSSGGYVDTQGRVSLAHGVPEGRGGDVSIQTYVPGGAASFATGTPPSALDGGRITMDGSILGDGFSGGGTFTLQAPEIRIGGNPEDLVNTNGLWLDPSFFEGQGFDNYQLHAITDATLAAGSHVVVQRQNLIANLDALRFLASGGDVRAPDISAPGTLDPYTRWATRDTRDGHGPGFGLDAGAYLTWQLTSRTADGPPVYTGVTGSVLVDHGASIDVDAGGSVTLQGTHATLVHGSVTAHGGDIAVGTRELGLANPKLADTVRAWLGADASLDASGIALINPFATPVAPAMAGNAAGVVPRTGVVLGGGDIDLTSNAGYVVAEKGAMLDVSGASDTFDLPFASARFNGAATDYLSSPVWSNGGTIRMVASELMTDATLRGAGGSAMAEGGTLSIGADFVANAAFGFPQPQRFEISQHGGLVPDGADEQGIIEADGPSGALRFAADSLAGSGITSVKVGIDGITALPLVFDGDVDLNLGRSFEALTTNIVSADGGKVAITAPYVSLLGRATALDGHTAGKGQLSLDATQIDIGGATNLNGWASTQFTATGDIRFTAPMDDAYGAQGDPVTGVLYTTGDLTFKAAQLYPVTDYRFAVIARNGDHDTTVSIQPNGPSYAPLSAGGALLIDADHIEQAGTVRVPSGNLVLGVNDTKAQAADFGIDASVYPLVATQSVHLAAGSVTSVSLDNLTVPYGTTIDGTEWRYNGSSVADSADRDAPPSKQVALHGDALALDAGATIDLSGGGSLQAGEWVPGTGGTRDVLAQHATIVGSGVGTGAAQYADGRAIYAILPGHQASVAPQDAAFAAQGGDGPAVGQQVYLSGMPGLPAGWYTLLPARYAELAGAYRVVQDTGAAASVPGRSARQADGGYSVTGYLGDALTGARDAQANTFIVQSRDVWSQYSQYTFTDADTFFGDKAQHAGTVAPRLAADAGRLMLDAGSRLDLGTTLTAAPASGGRSSQVDIAAQAIQVLGAQDTARDGYLGLSADGLSQLGAGSLLLGGTRTSTSEGDLVDAVADNLLLSNDAAHPLAGQEILLVARGNADGHGNGVLLESGSLLQARGSANPVGSQPLVFGVNPGKDAAGNTIAAVSGDGTLLRVSQNGAAPVIRHQVTGADGAAGTAQGKLTIDAGAVVQGGSALTLDATGVMHVDESASFSADAIDANANRIAFVGEGVDGGSNGLVIGPRTLDLFRNANQVTLRSRGEMDFLGDIAIALDHGLTLNAATMAGDGADVVIRAATVGLGNALGGPADSTVGGEGGRFDVQANEIDFGPGSAALRGFDQLSLTATQGMLGQGRGGVDFGGANVSLTTPVLIADSASNTVLTTTGALALAHGGGVALARDALGGSLSLSGGSVDVGTNITATAGALSLTANRGDLTIDAGASLDVAGVERTFFDTKAAAPGGNLSLLASHGNVIVGSGTSLLFGGGDEGGDAGSLSVRAANAARIEGNLDGHAAAGWTGGYFTYAAGTDVNLDDMARLAGTAGATGLLDITSGSGDLTLSAGQSLRAGKVYLYANGGSTRIDGSIDASGPIGGRIELYGRDGVDVEGKLDASSANAEQRGGDVVIGTAGRADGTVNGSYGYENVQRADAGVIHVGANAVIDVSGGSSTPLAGGRISFRAPLLADGDVPIQVDRPAGLVGARDVTIEPYAVWSTADATTGAQHFDGIVDPAGWYARDPVTGKPVMVAGTWTDAAGNVLAAPADDTELAAYLTKNFFTPTTANPDHAGFYGYVGGDAANGPGTLMGFIQAPGFGFGDRYAGITNLNIRPGIELDNPVDAGVDSGAIRILTNWNLGAGSTDAQGNITLAYRYGSEAPVVTFRAGGDVDVQASISDGFYQQNDGATLNDSAPPVDDNGYSTALASYQKSLAYMDASGLWNSGLINLKNGTTDIDGGTPGGGTADLTKDHYWAPLQAPLKNQSTDYYANYGQYIGEVGDASNHQWSELFAEFNNGPGFYHYEPTPIPAPQPGDFASYADYVDNYLNSWIYDNFFDYPGLRETTPSPLLTPIDANYKAYSANYSRYVAGHAQYDYYITTQVGSLGTGSQLFYAPFAPRSDAVVHDPAYDNALASYQKSLAYMDAINIWNNGTINLKNGSLADGGTPGGGVADLTKDKYWAPLQAPLLNQTSDYYANYAQYIFEVGDASNHQWSTTFAAVNNGPGFYMYAPTPIPAPQPGDFPTYAAYVDNYLNSWIYDNFFDVEGLRETTPSPLLAPVDATYKAYTANYAQYIAGHALYDEYVTTQVGSLGTGSQLFYAPFAPRSDTKAPDAPTNVPVPVSTPDNSPSNMPRLGSPASFASATLLGGESSSLRFVAGADFASANPLLVDATAGNVNLDGHFAAQDTLTDKTVVGQPNQYSGKTLLFPTTVRTGTGSIDVASSGDIQWLDQAAPAAIYTAGAPADGTTADTGIAVIRPSVASPAFGSTMPDMLVSGAVNPDNAGDVSLSAGGAIEGIQNPLDPDGSVTRGKAGTPMGQYWWQWMQTGNAADGSRSSINFANFAQGVMSAGGNVSVAAGGDITQLMVSLPTTWYANAARDAVTTVGGGNLDVHAGGSILSGGYFVGKGRGNLVANGGIGADTALASMSFTLGNTQVTSPVSTIVALQDADVSVQGRAGVDLGGVYNPSYMSSPAFTGLIPAGHADNQGYSADSAIDITATSGDVTFGSLKSPGSLFFGTNGIAGPVLPATVSMTALDGAINILAAGELYPSATGNLSLLATGDIDFSRQTVSDSISRNFGLIDSAADLPTPLKPTPATTFINFVENPTVDIGHDEEPLHGNDEQPVRIYALNGDINDGITAPNGFNYLSLLVAPSKPALVYAGRDIVNLAFIGQHTHAADITRIAAGRDIYDTAFSPGGFDTYITGGYAQPGRLLLGGPGAFLVEAGRDIGALNNALEVVKGSQSLPPLGIESIGNLYNPYLPHEGADVNVTFGVGPGVNTAGFLARYLDPADTTGDIGSFDSDLVAFMEQRVAGKVVDTGYAKDKLDVTLSVDEARALFQQEPEYVQRLFAERMLFRILGQVGKDYNDASSPYFGQYARGYDAVGTLFPSSYGYTANGAGEGGLNGAQSPVTTGNLDIRSTTIQSQQGGNVSIVGPGGQALVGSTSAPSQVVAPNGSVIVGPNTMGVLTLEQGDINLFTDRSVLLAQSRIFTEQGGDMVIWSSNGDINAGQGAKTTAEIPPPVYVCNVDAWCRLDARGQVSGAGIATLQSVEGAEPGSVYLIAPRGTVDAGDAGIRVAGNLYIAAARVANADNIQVKGDSVGIPVTAAVNVGALNAASAAATAASQAAEDVARKQQSDARDKVPSVISVNVLRDGDNGASVVSPELTSPVRVLGSGRLDSASASSLTAEERTHLRNN